MSFRIQGRMPVNTAVIIPARYASTRLPGKPLLRETGKYLIQHVYERAREAKSVSAVVVATDDERIARAVESFGGRAVMTRDDHVSGTDRVAEAAQLLDCEAVVNLQGDEPQFDPRGIDQLVGLLAADPSASAATLATPIRSTALYRDPNAVKVVCDNEGRALYFSRSPIPHCREGDPDLAANPPFALLHVGVYAFRTPALYRISSSRPHPLECAEKLEQLRILGMGGTIRVGVVPTAHRGVDTPADYAAFVNDYLNRCPARAA
jgi:3-deoxy-manno-octulosonate cytidylyltransferase (CMP-KDO synthetase)